MKTKPRVIGYYNHNSYPVSFTGPSGSPFSVEPGEPVLRGGTLTGEHPLCDNLVVEGLLRAILEGDKKFSRFVSNSGKVAASAAQVTAKDANRMPPEQVPVTTKLGATNSLIPEAVVDGMAAYTLPSGATRNPDGTISYKGTKYSQVAFTNLIKSGREL